jgi:hypothetical protein
MIRSRLSKNEKVMPRTRMPADKGLLAVEAKTQQEKNIFLDRMPRVRN